MAEPLQPPSGFPGIPVSIFNSPVDQLLADGALTGAARPGVLGNVGRFEVLRMVGVGGMGIVALARDPQRQEMVAVKFLRPDLASVSAAVSRFRAEAHHMQRLNHPGILPVLEVVENGSSPCFVMPYMVGGSLAQALRAAKPLSTEQVLCVSLSIAEALVHAHSKGIIHRDLKPANVLLTPEGKACLSDFGLSRTVFNDSYVDLDKGHCEGTAPYMSPAVASGEAEDTRCDIYGFGAMLYEMLAGNPPYQGESTQVILEKIRSGPPSPIKDLNAKAHPGLATIAEGAMARELRQRYARMADVLEDLRLVESGSSPVGPRGLRGFSALRHRIRRVPTTTWRLMASALILLLVCVSLWWYTGWRLQVTSTLSLPQIKSWVETRTAQWDGVKGLEFIVPQESNGDLLPVTRQGQILHTFKIPAEGEPPLRISMVADLDQNGLEEVLVGWADPNQAHLSAINQNAYQLRTWSVKRTDHVSEGWGKDHTALYARGLLDLDGDARRELLVGVQSNRSQPRGLYCFNVEPLGLLKWQCTLAGVACSLETADLDGNGKSEIVLGTYACSNGLTCADGTDDQHSYLHVFSPQGDPLWKREIGDYYTSVNSIVTRAADGSPVLFAWTSSAWDMRQKYGHPKPHLGLIVAFDGSGQQLGQYDAGRALLSCVAFPAVEGSCVRIAATDCAGRLHLLGLTNAVLSLFHSPQALVSKRFDEVLLKIVGTFGPAGRSWPRLIMASVEREILGESYPGAKPDEVNKEQWHNRSVMVVDEAQEVRARFTEPGPWSSGPRWRVITADLNEDGTQEILWLDERLRVLELVRGR